MPDTPNTPNTPNTPARPGSQLADYDFDLPEALIATRPVRPRSSARMLVAGRATLTDATARELPGFLAPGDRLVLNDTKVLAARLRGTRRRGAAEAGIEATLLAATADGAWTALVKPLRKLRAGEVVRFAGGLSAVYEGRDADGQALLRFNLAGPAFDAALAQAGEMPLPPYIAGRRRADDRDRADYQTVWAARPGAIAAPTASLHFDAALLAGLAARGVETTRVTLHVGAGTFLPVKVTAIEDHKMHAEWGEVTETAAREIAATRAAGGRIVPVGTTALRLIESAAATGEIAPWQGETEIFIRPGYRFRVTDALVTNFHLPKSTLMMLVSALMGYERMRAVYAHAIAARYRFFSYGDASLLMPAAP